jgi:hypothetical protein
MIGIHAQWFADPGTLRIVAACTFALVLTIRVLARILVQHLLRTNRRKSSFRYRIPLQPAHPARARVRGARGAIARVPSVAVRPTLREAPIARRSQDDAPAMADLDKP